MADFFIPGCVIFVTGSILAAVLWFCVRAFRSDLRMRHAQNRLRQPCPKEVERQWGVRLPVALADFYRDGAAVERQEFFLESAEPDARRWYVAWFIPLTKLDAAEWIYASGVPGIPIAVDDCNKTYYLPFDALRRGESPPVLLRDPEKKGEDAVVAATFGAFVKFRPVERDLGADA